MNNVLKTRISLALVFVWTFLLGWVTAIGFGCGHGWSKYQFTLYLPEGGITGYQFMELFNAFRWLYMIITIVMMIWILICMREG